MKGYQSLGVTLERIMFSRKLLFSCSVLTLLVSASVGHLTLLDTVLTIVGKMDSLHLAMADISGSYRTAINGSRYEYQADFSCQNGKMDVGQFTLVDGPYLTGSDGEAQLQFTVSVGSSSVIYASCREVTMYPSNHTNHVYTYTNNMIKGSGLEASSTVLIKRDGFSCSTKSSVYIPTNVTALLDTWWSDCPGCEIVIAAHINQTLHESLIPVVENIVSGSDLCFLLDY
uniref:Dicer-like protein 2 n=1 Tax=Lygus hesperus TaxID=30085 RepID=A0A0A9XY91_LYGHE